MTTGILPDLTFSALCAATATGPKTGCGRENIGDGSGIFLPDSVPASIYNKVFSSHPEFRIYYYSINYE